MGRADDIIFRIGANAKPFVSAMGGAKKALGSFLALAGAGISVSAIKSIVSEVGNIADIADKVSLTTDELQKLRFAGEQTGVATSALDVAMQRFTRRTAEAATGSGELLKIFKANGVALKNQDGSMRKQIDILRDYADLIKNAGSQQKRLLLTFKAFDTEGAALVNFLGQGSDGMDRYFQSATDLGIALEEGLIRQAGELDSKYSALAKTFDTYFKGAVVETAVAVDHLSESLQAAAKGEGKIGLLKVEIAGLKDALAITEKDEYNILDKLTLWHHGGADGIISKISEAKEEILELRRLQRDNNLGIENQANQYSQYRTPGEKPEKTVIPDPRTVAEKAAAKRAAESAARKAEAAAKRRADSIRNVVEALKHEYENLGRTADQQKLYNSLKRAGVELDSEAGRAIEDRVRILTAEQNLLSGKAFALEEQKKQADAFKSSLDYLTQSGIAFGESFAGSARKSSAELRKMGLELLGLLLKAKLLGQGPLAGLFGGGVNTNISPAVNSAMAAGRGGLYADGGVIGGKIIGPGTGTSDSILARNISNGSNIFVSNGEGIVTARGMQNNPGILEKLNSGVRLMSYANGGVIGGGLAASNESHQRTAPKIIIHNYGNDKVEAKTSSNGADIDIYVADALVRGPASNKAMKSFGANRRTLGS